MFPKQNKRNGRLERTCGSQLPNPCSSSSSVKKLEIFSPTPHVYVSVCVCVCSFRSCCECNFLLDLLLSKFIYCYIETTDFLCFFFFPILLLCLVFTESLSFLGESFGSFKNRNILSANRSNLVSFLFVFLSFVSLPY